MTTKNKIQIAGGVVIGVLIGMAIYAYKQSKLLQSLCYQIVSVNYLGSQGGITNFAINIKFFNYSDLAVNVNGYNINAYVDDALVGESKMSGQSYLLQPKTSSIMRFEAKTNTTQAIGDLLARTIDGLLSKEDSRFKLVGTLDINAGLIRVKDYPIDLQWTGQQIIDDIQDKETCPAIT